MSKQLHFPTRSAAEARNHAAAAAFGLPLSDAKITRAVWLMSYDEEIEKWVLHLSTKTQHLLTEADDPVTVESVSTDP